MYSFLTKEVKRNVVVFFGINGVGKSTITSALNESIFNSEVIQASSVLLDALGITNRQALEELAPDKKMAIKIPALIKKFKGVAKNNLDLLDMHLLVPIRKGKSLIYEDVWSDDFFPYLLKAYFIYAEPSSILIRRSEDFKMTGRKRNMSLEGIESDQEVNLKRFSEIFFNKIPHQLIDSSRRSIQEINSLILKDLEKFI